MEISDFCIWVFKNLGVFGSWFFLVREVYFRFLSIHNDSQHIGLVFFVQEPGLMIVERRVLRLDGKRKVFYRI